MAWALSVDDWSEDWTIEVRRKVVKNSLDVNRLKGTTKALQTALDSVGYGLRSVYWHEDPEIEKGYFKVTVSASSVPIDEKFYKQAQSIINENKRGTLHLKSLEVKTETKANLKVISTIKMGERIGVLPRLPEPIKTSSNLNASQLTRFKEIYIAKPV